MHRGDDYRNGLYPRLVRATVTLAQPSLWAPKPFGRYRRRVRRFWKRRIRGDKPLISIGQLSFDQVLVLDAMFARWRDEDDFGESFRITDAVERFCFINLGADIEGAIGETLFDERYGDRLSEARIRLERKHDLAD